MAKALFPSLKKGDKIGVMAPSSYVEREDIDKSKQCLEDIGYQVFIHPQTYERQGQMAGTTLQKALAFQGLWLREDIHAIWAAGGGNRALQLADAINFNKLKAKPKLLIGYSDVTALLNTLYAKTGIMTCHGPVFKELHTYDHLSRLMDSFSNSEVDSFLKDAKIIQEGKAKGRLIGGNFSVFQYLLHQFDKSFYQDAILCLEDCNEELNQIDRMFLYLKSSGILDHISGLVLGKFINPKDSGRPFGFTIEDIIKEHLQGTDIPVVMNATFGHIKNQRPFIIGQKSLLSTADLSLKAI